MSNTAQVTVTLQEPVSTTRQARSDFRQDTHDHVPGAVLRGALAARWIQHHGEPSTTDSEFAEIFEGGGSFGPLHAHGGLPVPLSVARHKYEPGGECKQLWWDRALGETASRCADCDQKLEESKGQAKEAPEHVARTRVALDEHGVAQDGNLFVQNTLARTTELTGWLHGPAVRALHLDGEPIESLLLGAGRSVRGRATVRAETGAVPEPVEQDENLIVLRLASPGIFVDEFGLPADGPDGAEIAEVLGIGNAEVETSWTRWTEAGGWHIASGLPKPAERAVERGSTYRIRCSEPASKHARRTLMARGIGLRRREGFGALGSPPAAPIGPGVLVSTFAPLLGWKLLPRLLHQLRDRAESLRNGTVDDAKYRTALDNMEQKRAAAFRKLLDLSDPRSYLDVLDYLENGT